MGNVGIGTTNPNFKLEVSGTASTTNLNVPGILNASSSILTNATTTGQTFLSGVTAGKMLALDQNGMIVATTSFLSSVLAGTNINISGGNTVNLNGNVGLANLWATGFLNASTSTFTNLNASSSILTNATTTGQMAVSVKGSFLASDAAGMITATTTPIMSLTGGTNINTSGNTINLNSNVLGISLFSGLTMNASTSNFGILNASSSILTNATTTGQTFLTGVTAGQLLATNANGMVIATTTSFITLGNLSGTAPITYNTGTGAIGLQSNFGSMGVYTSGYLNASSSQFTNTTTTGASYLTGLTAGNFLALSPSGQIITTTTPIITLANGTNTTASGNSINLNANVLGETLFSGLTMNASTATFTNLNASSSIFTNTTTTGQTFLTGLSFGKVLALDQNGMVVATTTTGGVQSVTASGNISSSGGVNPNITLNSNVLGVTLFSGLTMNATTATFNNLNASSSILTSATTTNLAIGGVTGCNILNTTALGTVGCNTTAYLTSVLGGTNINITGSNTVNLNGNVGLANLWATGFLNASTSTFTNLNASTSVLTNATIGNNTTTGQTFLTGVTAGQLLATNGNGMVISTTTQFITLNNLSASSPLNYNNSTGAISLTGVVPVQNGGTGQSILTAGDVLYGNGTNGLATSSNFTFSGSVLNINGAVNATTSTFTNLNASSSILTNATSTNIYGTNIYDTNLLGRLVATDANGMLVATTTQFITLGNLSGTAPITYNTGTGAIGLQSNFGSQGVYTSGYLNASTSVITSATTTNLAIGGVTGCNILNTTALGTVGCNTTAYLTSVLGGTNINVTGGNTVNLNSSILGETLFSGTTMNATTATFNNLNASSSILTNATTTGQMFLSGSQVSAGNFLAVNANGMVVSTTSPIITLQNGTNATASGNQVNLNSNVGLANLWATGFVNATTSTFTNLNASSSILTNATSTNIYGTNIYDTNLLGRLVATDANGMLVATTTQFITLGNLSGTAPITYNTGTGAIGLQSNFGSQGVYTSGYLNASTSVITSATTTNLAIGGVTGCNILNTTALGTVGCNTTAYLTSVLGGTNINVSGGNTVNLNSSILGETLFSGTTMNATTATFNNLNASTSVLTTFTGTSGTTTNFAVTSLNQALPVRSTTAGTLFNGAISLTSGSSDITGTLAVGNGGTGATTLAGASIVTASAANGQVPYFTGATTQSGSNNFTFNGSNLVNINGGLNATTSTFTNLNASTSVLTNVTHTNSTTTGQTFLTGLSNNGYLLAVNANGMVISTTTSFIALGNLSGTAPITYNTGTGAIGLQSNFGSQGVYTSGYLNASTSVITSATTTNLAIGGVTGCNILNTTALGTVGCNTTAYLTSVLGGTNINVTGGNTVNLNSSILGETLFSGTTMNATTATFNNLNASSSILTNATTTGQMFLSGSQVSAGNFLAVNANGMVVSTTSPIITLQNGTNTTASGNQVNLNSNVGLANLWATGFVNATTSTFTNLNASSSIFTNATTTGQTFLSGVTAGNLLAVNANGMVISTTTSFIALGNLSGTAPITYNTGTGAIGLQSNFGSQGVYTSGYLNASTSVITSATTTNLAIGGVTGCNILNTTALGTVGCNTTAYLTSVLGGTNINVTGGNTVNLNSSILGETLFSGTTMNATTATFNNLNASSSILTNATTTGQMFLSGSQVSAGNFLAVNANGMVVSTTSPIITLQNGTNTTASGNQVNLNSNVGLANLWATGFVNATTSTFTNLNASTSVLTNVTHTNSTTTGQTFLTGLSNNGYLLAVNANGMVISTTTSFIALGNLSGTAPITYNTGTGAIGLQSNFGSQGVYTSGYLNASTSVITSATTTNLAIGGVTGCNILNTTALGTVGCNTTAYLTSVLGGTNINVTGGNTVNLNSSILGETLFSGTTMNATTATFNNLNASSSILTNATTTGQMFLSGSQVSAGNFLAVNANGMVVSTTSPIITLQNGTNTTASGNQVNLNSNVGLANLWATGFVNATTSTFTNLNASTSVLTNVTHTNSTTTGQTFLTGLSNNGYLLAVNANGMVISTTTSFIALGNLSGTAPITYNTGTGAIGLQSNFGSQGVYTSGYLNASTSVITSATTTNLAIGGVTGCNILNTTALGTVGCNTTAYLTSVLGGTNINVTGGNTVNLNSSILGETLFSGTTMNATTATFNNLNASTSVLTTFTGTSGTTTNFAVTSLNQALPVRSTTAGTLFNGAISLTSGSSDITGTLAVGNGGTGATTLAGASIVTASAANGQVPYFTGATTQSGSNNFTFNGSNLVNINGGLNATTSTFTNLNASTSVLTNVTHTNSTTTGQTFLTGLSNNGYLLAVNANGMVISTTTSFIALGNLSGTAPITYNTGTGAIGLQSNFGSQGVYTSGYLNASTSVITSATTTNLAIGGVTGCNILNTTALGTVGCNTTAYLTSVLGGTNINITGGNTVNLNSSILGETLFSGTTMNATTATFNNLNASSSILTNATTTGQMFLSGSQVSAGNFLAVNANGMVVSTTSPIITLQNGTNTTASGNQVNLNSNVGLANLWATGFVNATTSTFTNLNASTSVLTNVTHTNSTTTGQTFLTGLSNNGYLLAVNANGMVISTTTSFIALGNLSGTAPITYNTGTGAIGLQSNFGSQGVYTSGYLNASTSVITSATTTNLAIGGVTGCNILNTTALGTVGCNTTAYLTSVLGGTNINITGGNTVNLNSSILGETLFSGLTMNATTATFTNLNASTSVLTNATIGNNTTTGQTFLSGVTAGNLLAVNANGMVISTTTSFIALGNLSGTAPITYNTGTGAIGLQSNFGSQGVYTSGYLNASTSVITSATTTNLAIGGVTGCNILNTTALGTVGCNTTAYLTSVLGGTNINITGSNTVNLNTSILGETLFSGLTMNATTATFTNLNASSSILTNATTTGQMFLSGSQVSAGNFLAVNANGMVISTTSPIITLQNGTNTTASGNQVNLNSNVGLANLWATGFVNATTSTFTNLNASTSVLTNVTHTNSTTTGQTFLTGLSNNGYLLAVNANGMVISTTTSFIALGNLSGTAPITYNTGTGAIGLQSNFGSQGVYTSGYLNASTSVITSATTTNLAIGGVTGCNILNTTALGTVGCNTTAYLTSVLGGTNINVTGGNTVNLNSSILGETLFSGTTMNATTATFNNLNASTSVLTNATIGNNTTTGQTFLSGVTAGNLLAVNANGMVISTTTSFIALGNLSGTAPITYNTGTGAIGLQSNFGSMNVYTSGFVNASTSVITSATTTNLAIGGVTGCNILNTTALGTVGCNTTAYLTSVLGGTNINVTGGNTVNLNTSILGETLFSGLTMNATTATFTNLNASSSILTNATTTGQMFLSGSQVSAGNFLAVNANGMVVSTTSPIITLQNGTNTTASGNQVNLNSNVGLANLWATGFVNATTSTFTNLNASSSILTNATSTNIYGTNIYDTNLLGRLVATDANGMLIATTTQFITLGNLSGTAPITYNTGTGAIGLQSNFGSQGVYTSGYLNASTSVITSATTTNLAIGGVTGCNILNTTALGTVGCNTTAYLTSVLGGTNINVTGGNTVNLNSSILGETLFSGTTMNATTATFNNLNASTSVLTTFTGTSGTTTNFAVTSLNQALPVRSTTAGTLFNGAISLTSGSSDITGTLAVGNGGTGATTLAGASIVTASAANGQVPYFTGATTQSGSNNFTFNGSNLVNINGGLNATTSTFTNLNASTSVLTNVTHTSATTTNLAIGGVTGCNILNTTALGTVGCNTTAYLTSVLGGTNINVTGGNTVNLNTSILGETLFSGTTMNATTATFNNLNASTSVLTTFTGTSGTTTNFAVTSLNQALPVRSTTAGTLFNGAISLTSGSSDITGTLAVGNGGTGATTLAGASIVTASAANGQVPYFTGATTQSGSNNFTFNGSNLVNINGGLNATTSTFTNLNASTSVLTNVTHTNSTTTGQTFLTGLSNNGYLLAVNANGMVISTTTSFIALGNLSGTAPITYNTGTGAIGLQSNFGSQGVYTSGYLNASTSVITSATTTNLAIGGVTGCNILNTTALGTVGCNTTAYLTSVLGGTNINVTGGNTVNLNSSILGETLFSGTTMNATTATFNNLNASTSVLTTFTGTSGTTTNFAVTSLNQALPVRSTTAGTLFNGAISLTSGSSDITGTLAVGNGGTGATTLAGASIVTASAANGQVPYFTGATTQSGSNNFTFNGSNLVNINGTINATTSTFTNLNASTSVLTNVTHTNSTTTGQTFLTGLPNNGYLLAVNANGMVISTTTSFIALGNLSGTAPITYNTGTGAIGLQSNFGSQGVYTSGYLNASTSVITSATTTNLAIGGVTGCNILNTTALGTVGCNTTAYLTSVLGGTNINVTGGNTVNLNSSILGETLFSGTTMNATTATFNNLNASSSILTNATTTGQMFLSGSQVSAGNFLAVNANGMVISTTSPIITLQNGTNTTASGNQVNLNSNVGLANLWATGFVNATTSTFTNLNASSSILTNATSTNIYGTNIYDTNLLGRLVATDANGMLVATTTQFITLGNLSGTAPITYNTGTGAIGLQSNFGSQGVYTSGYLNASTSVITSATTTNLAIGGVTGCNILNTTALGTVGCNTTAYLTSVLGGTNINVSGGNTVNLNSSILGETLFSGLTMNATTATFTNLNASSSILTNATTTGQMFLSGSQVSAGNFLAVNANGMVVSTTSPIITLQNGTNTTASGNQVNLNSNVGLANLWATGFVNATTSTFTNLNASSSILTNATSTNIYGTNIYDTNLLGRLVATDANGMVISTTTSFIALGNLSGTAPITYNTGTGAIGLQSNFGSMNVYTSGFVNASTSVITSATTTNLAIGGVTGCNILNTTALGTVGCNTTAYLTSVLGGTNINVTGGNTVNLNTSILGETLFSGTTMNATTATFNNLNASTSVLTTFTGTSGTTTNFAVTSLNQALPVRSTTAGTLFNGAISLTSGSSDITGTLAVGNGGTGATTLAGASIVTASAANGQVPYFTGATTQSGSNNFTFNGSNLVNINGGLNATTSTFTNLNASTSVLTNVTHTNSTTTGQTFLTGLSNNGYLLAVNANGMVISTTTSFIALGNLSGTAPITYNTGTGAIGLQSNFGSQGVYTSGYLNASTSVITSATTTNLAIGGVTGCNILNTTALGTVGCNTTAYLTSVLGGTNINVTGGNTVNLNSSILGETLFSGTTMNATTATFNNLNASTSVLTTFTGTSGTTTNFAVTSLNQALPVRSTTAGTLFNGAISLTSGSSDITGTLAVGNGGTGATTLAGASIVTASAANGQVPYFTGATTQSGSNNFTFNGSNLVNINGGLNATTSTFTNLNASSTIFTNATTTGQAFFKGVTAGSRLAVDANGMLIATTSPIITLANGTNTTASGNQVNLNSNVGLANLWATGFVNATTSTFTNLNASSSIFTNATTTGQTFLSGVTAGNLLAVNANGMVISTTTSFIALGNLSGTAPITYNTGTGAIGLQSNFGSQGVYTSGYLNASTSVITSATTTNLAIGGVTGCNILNTTALGTVGCNTTAYLTSVLGGTNINVTGGNTVNLNSSILGETLFSGLTMNATTATFTNLNATSSIFTNATTTGQFYTLGQTYLATNGGNVGIGTTSPVSKLSVVGESAFAGGAVVGLAYAGTAAPSNGLIIQGNVGIGTTSPLAVLHVAQDASSTASSTLFTVTTPVLQLGELPLSSPSGSGTYLGVNAPSNFGGNLLAFQRNGSNVFTVNYQGGMTVHDISTSGNNGAIYGNLIDTAASWGPKVNGVQGGANTTIPFTSQQGGGVTWSGGSDANFLLVNASAQGTVLKTGGQFNLLAITSAFVPVTGTGTINSLNIGTTINQNGTSSGVSRGILISPTLTSAYDYRNLEIAATTNTLSTSTNISISYNALFNPLTYTSASSSLYTLANASTLNIAGAPIGTTASTTISTSTALMIQGNALTNVTNGYGMIVNAPTGASTANYAAAFMGGNVGIGNASPAGKLDVEGSGNIILNAGNVGIGTSTAPGYALQVNVTADTGGGIMLLPKDGWATGRDVSLFMGAANHGITSSYAGNDLWQGYNGISFKNAAGTTLALGTDAFGGTGNVAIGGNITDLAAFTGASMVIKSGNVGIGTTSPSQLLTVGNNNQFTVTSGGTVTAGASILVPTFGAGISVGTTTTLGLFNLSKSAEGSVPALGVNSSYLNLTASNLYGLIAGVLGTGNAYIQAQRTDITATAYNLLLQPNGGNVGIGTTGPAYLLDVNGTARAGGVILTALPGVNGDIGMTGNNMYLEGNSAGGSIFLRPNGTGSNTGLFTVNTTGFISSGTGNSSIAGNVGIGTTTVGSRLVVQGAGADGTTNALSVVNSAGTSEMVIQNNGNVGHRDDESQLKIICLRKSGGRNIIHPHFVC